MRSTGARPSLIRASAPLAPPHAFVLPPPRAARPSNPSDSLLHHNSIVLILHLPPFALRFSRSVRYHPAGSPLYVQRAYRPRNACSRNTYVSYARNVRTNELHVSGKHPTREVISGGLELSKIDEIARISEDDQDLVDELRREGGGSIRIRCFRNLLRGPLLTKGGDTERIFGGLNPIVLTQGSGEKKSLSYPEKVYIEREEGPSDALAIFPFFSGFSRLFG